MAHSLALSQAATKSPFPDGVQSLFWFFFLNFLSCQIIMDSPIFLYAESLGASATIMGLIAGMTPLMVIFQIPAAAHVGRWGYRFFIATGWTVRLLFVLGLIFVPMMDGVLNSQSQLALVIVLLFAFNIIRGIASCAWFPWIRGLIPETIRGRYLTLESAFANAGSLVAFLLVAIYLGKSPTSGQFTVLFAFSFVMGAVSIAFIRRVPDVAPPKEEAGKTTAGLETHGIHLTAVSTSSGVSLDSESPLCLASFVDHVDPEAVMDMGRQKFAELDSDANSVLEGDELDI